MRLLYCDETNLEKKEDDFFAYAGLIIPCDTAPHLHGLIEKARKKYGLKGDELLKFSQGPKSLSHVDFAHLKQEVIEAAIATHCQLLVTLISHNVATDADTARRNAINQIAYNFDLILQNKKDHGLVLIDRFSDAQVDAHLRQKFSQGILGLRYTPKMPLTRILGFQYSAIGQSHFPSVVDIAIGTLRYAINAHCRKDAGRKERAAEFVRMLSPLFEMTDYKNSAGIAWVKSTYLDFTPKTIKSTRYREQYESLRIFLAQNGLMAEQAIGST